MNCDEVFAILTRGPFPTGSRLDGAVESHLRRCVVCQRLAEALRPNADLLRESVGIEESRVLPGYWGAALPNSSDLAVSLDERGYRLGKRPLPRRLPTRSVRSESLKLWQFAAAVALGIVLDGAFRTLVSVHATEASQAVVKEPARNVYQRDGVESGSIEIDKRSDNPNEPAEFPTTCIDRNSSLSMIEVSPADASVPMSYQPIGNSQPSTIESAPVQQSRLNLRSTP